MGAKKGELDCIFMIRMYFSKDCQLHFGIFWTLNWGPVLPSGVGNPLSVATKKFKRFSASLEKENKFGQNFKWTLPLAKVMERLNMWRAPWKMWHKEGFRRTAGQLSGSSIKSTFRCPVVSKHTVGYLSSVPEPPSSIALPCIGTRALLENTPHYSSKVWVVTFLDRRTNICSLTNMRSNVLEYPKHTKHTTLKILPP